jgi:hypothetical protein
MCFVFYLKEVIKMIMQFFIRFFGLKGSFAWACRQMKRGCWVSVRAATGTVKYALDHEEQQRILWTFKDKPHKYSDFQNANMFLHDFHRIDWYVVKEPSKYI